MTPEFRIYFDSADVTAAVADRLLELSITDEAGIESDQIKLVLDDRRADGKAMGGAVADLPRIGGVCQVAMGYKETGLVPMGTYLIDEIEISSPPATLQVSAKAADMTSSFRSPVSFSWDTDTIDKPVTLGNVVTILAEKHGYIPRVDPELASIDLGHIDQTEESDMAFLTRIAQRHDAVAKPADGHLVFAKEGSTKSVSGKTLPTIQLRHEKLTRWRFSHSARNTGGQAGASTTSSGEGGVKAYWWDVKKAERMEVLVGSEPFEEIRYVHRTEQEAMNAASARRGKGERSQGGLSFSLPGNPKIGAESQIEIDLRPGIPNQWRATRVEHRLNRQGYTTSVECERAE